MSTIKIDFKKIEKQLNKINDDINKDLKLRQQVEEGNNMVVLKDTEKEFLKIIIDNKHKDNYSCDVGYEKFPEYIQPQLKDLCAKLKYAGYLASQTVYMSGISVTLTPEGLSYFEKENEYIQRNSGNFINNGIINYGDITNSSFNFDNSYTQIEKMIEEQAPEESEILKDLLNDVKEYIDNIIETQAIVKNKKLFSRIGDHFVKHQWFYGSVVNLIGTAVLQNMGK